MKDVRENRVEPHVNGDWDTPLDDRRKIGMYVALGTLVSTFVAMYFISDARVHSPYRHLNRFSNHVSFNVAAWKGYVECADGKKNVFVRSDDKVVSLEEALSHVPEELGRRSITREMITEVTDRYECSE